LINSGFIGLAVLCLNRQTIKFKKSKNQKIEKSKNQKIEKSQKISKVSKIRTENRNIVIS